MRDGSSGPGPKEGVEHEVAGVSANVEDAFNQAFWFWGSENVITKEDHDFLLGFLCMSDLLVWPESLGDDALLYFG